MAVYQLDVHTPQIADSAWVADSAQVMGEVEMAAGDVFVIETPGGGGFGAKRAS